MHTMVVWSKCWSRRTTGGRYATKEHSLPFKGRAGVGMGPTAAAKSTPLQLTTTLSADSSRTMKEEKMSPAFHRHPRADSARVRRSAVHRARAGTAQGSQDRRDLRLHRSVRRRRLAGRRARHQDRDRHDQRARRRRGLQDRRRSTPTRSPRPTSPSTKPFACSSRRRST